MKELFFSLPSFMVHDCLLGNIEQSEAESIVKHIEDTLFNAPNSLCKPLFPSQYMSRRAVMLEKGLKYYHQTEGSNQKDENSALIQYIQVQYIPLHGEHSSHPLCSCLFYLLVWHYFLQYSCSSFIKLSIHMILLDWTNDPLHC